MHYDTAYSILSKLSLVANIDLDYLNKLRAMISTANIVDLKTGEEFVVRASASGETMGLAVGNNGSVWIVGNNESHTLKVVDSDYSLCIMINSTGEAPTLVIVTGMGEFVVIERSGVYFHNSFTIDLDDDLTDKRSYFYWNCPDSNVFSLQHALANSFA